MQGSIYGMLDTMDIFTVAMGLAQQGHVDCLADVPVRLFRLTADPAAWSESSRYCCCFPVQSLSTLHTLRLWQVSAHSGCREDQLRLADLAAAVLQSVKAESAEHLLTEIRANIDQSVQSGLTAGHPAGQPPPPQARGSIIHVCAVNMLTREAGSGTSAAAAAPARGCGFGGVWLSLCLSAGAWAS